MYRTFNMSAFGPYYVFVHCTIGSAKTAVFPYRM